MGFWLALGILAVSFVGMIFLAPKPKTQTNKPKTFDDFDFPTAREGTPTPLIWGRVKLKGPNIIYHGNLIIDRLRKKVKSGLFSSKRVTVGYNYALTLQLCIGIGKDMILHHIWFGNRSLWNEELNPSTKDTGGYPRDGIDYDDIIDIPTNRDNVDPWGAFYGKDGQGGYVSGTIRYQNGRDDQGPNQHVANIIGEDMTASYRGMGVVTFEDFFLGESTRPEPVYFEVSTYPNALGFTPIGADCNPIEVIWDILTNTWGRLGESPVTFFMDEFIAAGNILETEEHGMSLIVARPNEARDILQEILAQIDGLLYLREDNLTGIQLIREVDDLSAVPMIDENTIIKFLEYNQADWSSTINQVRITYPDRDNDYKEKTVIVQDSGNIALQNKLVSTEFNFPGLRNGEVAHQVASRELRMLSVPLISCRFIVNRAGTRFVPGTLIQVNWVEYGIQFLTLRIQKIDYGILDKGEITLDCVQDAYSLYTTVFTRSPVTAFVPTLEDPDNPHASTPFPLTKVFEAPYWYADAIYFKGDGDLRRANEFYMVYLAANIDDGINGMGAQVLEVPGDPAIAIASDWRLDTDEADIPLYGILELDIEQFDSNPVVSAIATSGDASSVTPPDTLLFADIPLFLEELGIILHNQRMLPVPPEIGSLRRFLLTPTTAIYPELETFLAMWVDDPHELIGPRATSLLARLQTLEHSPMDAQFPLLDQAETRVLSHPDTGSGERLMLVGEEIMYARTVAQQRTADEPVRLLIRAWRGMLDTRRVAHLAGEEVWLFGREGSDNMSQQALEFDAGVEFDIRLFAERMNGRRTNYTYSNYAYTQRNRRPAPPDELGFLYTLDGIPQRHIPSTSNIRSATDDTRITIAWKETNRTNRGMFHNTRDSQHIERDTQFIAKWTVDGGPQQEQVISHDILDRVLNFASQPEGFYLTGTVEVGAKGQLEFELWSRLYGFESYQPYKVSVLFI